MANIRKSFIELAKAKSNELGHNIAQNALKHTQTYAGSWWNRDHNYSSEELASFHITTQTLDRITDFGWKFIQMVKGNDKFFPTVNYSDQNAK